MDKKSAVFQHPAAHPPVTPPVSQWDLGENLSGCNKMGNRLPGDAASHPLQRAYKSRVGLVKTSV